MSQKKSSLLHPDDLAVGDLLAVHSIKGTSMSAPFFGQACEVKAIRLPFVVAQPVGVSPPVTLDVRYLNFIRVDKAYADAQVPAKPTEADGASVNQILSQIISNRQAT